MASDYKQLLEACKQYASMRYDLLRLELLEKISKIFFLLLLAPTSGAELRGKIIELLKSKGISKEKFDELVALITARVKSFTNMNDLEIIVDEVLAEEGELQQNAKL
jgi:hypothetical protein